MDVAGIFAVFRRTDRAEHLVGENFGEAQDGVERRAQLMAHVGEEFGLRLVGGLGPFLLRLIVGIGGRQLFLLPLQLLLRGGEVADRRHQAPLGFAQPLLMALHHRDVCSDRHHAAIAGAPFVDLQPAFVRKLDLCGARKTVVVGVGDPSLDHRTRGRSLDDGLFGAGDEHAVGQPVGLLEVSVTHHQPVVLVPEDEGFRGAFDGVRQPLVGFRIALRQTMLLGDVHGDADHMGAAAGAAGHLGARPHPDIVAGGVTHAKHLVDLLGIAAADGARQSIEIAVGRMHHPGSVGEGEDVAGGRQAEHLVHRTGPEQTPVGDIEIPEAAAAARQRRLDAQVGFQEGFIGLAGSLHLHVIGIEDDQQDGGDAGK